MQVQQIHTALISAGPVKYSVLSKPRDPYYYTIVMLLQSFQPMAVQLSVKAALPLDESIAIYQNTVEPV